MIRGSKIDGQGEDNAKNQKGGLRRERKAGDQEERGATSHRSTDRDCSMQCKQG